MSSQNEHFALFSTSKAAEKNAPTLPDLSRQFVPFSNVSTSEAERFTCPNVRISRNGCALRQRRRVSCTELMASLPTLARKNAGRVSLSCSSETSPQRVQPNTELKSKPSNGHLDTFLAYLRPPNAPQTDNRPTSYEVPNIRWH